MPSKRHGAQTRKQWLRMRLELARDRTGAFDVERLLRATRFYYNEFDYKPSPADTNKQAELYARALAESLRTDYSEVEARIAAAGIPYAETLFPSHWTDEQRRQYLTQGFVVEIGEANADDKAHRKSPPIHVWVAGLDCGPLDRDDDIEVEI